MLCKVKSFLLDHKVVVILFVITLVISQLYTPWVLPEDDINNIVNEHINISHDSILFKVILWSYSFFWSGISDFWGLNDYATETGNDGFQLFGMIILTIAKMIDNKISKIKSEKIIVRYMKSNIFFSITAYTIYFLSPFLSSLLSQYNKKLILTEDPSLAMLYPIIYILLAIFFLPSFAYVLSYVLLFTLSFDILGYILNAINLPVFAEAAFCVVFVIIFVILTEWLANIFFFYFGIFIYGIFHHFSLPENEELDNEIPENE